MNEAKEPLNPNEATLNEGEFHPSAASAYQWYKMNIVANPIRFLRIQEAIASTALSGNRISDLCLSTMNRIEKKQPVSDRYLLGMCWFLRDMMEVDLAKRVSKLDAAEKNKLVAIGTPGVNVSGKMFATKKTKGKTK